MLPPYDPARHCGSAGRRCRTDPPACNHEPGDHHCRMTKGYRTDHVGSGNCTYHGGGTPNGKRHAAEEAAQKAIAKLGIPVGSGDPFVLLEKTVRHAEGYLEATGQVLSDVATTDKADKGLGVEAAAQLYADAIRAGARVGKAAVDADVAERRAVLDERAANLLMRFVRELLDRVAPPDRPAIEAWAAARMTELAAEYERVH